jgi:hypothetical protein
MDLNEPLILNGEYQFCEVGNRLALDYLDSAYDAVRNIYEGNFAPIRQRTDEALLKLAEHANCCADCNED